MDRWRTRFGTWVKGYGPNRLARDVGRGLYGQPLTPEAIYQWVSGTNAPRPQHALRIVQLARGRVSFEDIYGQRTAATPRP